MKVGDRGESCPPKLGGQPSEQSERGGWFRFGTTPARQLLLSCRATPPNGFAQKILGGHRPPLQLGVRNCRGALWSCEKNDLDEILGDAKHRPEVRTSFIGQINTKNFRTRSGFFSEVNLFTVPMSAHDLFFVQSRCPVLQERLLMAFGFKL